MDDLISRQAAIDAVDSETVSTNPEHFKSSEKFIKFMDDADISSFGIWQWSNGFNTALVATTIQLKKLPSAQPKERTEERTETHACDSIDREAAVDAIYHHLPSVSRMEVRLMLHEVPSAQPEHIKGHWTRDNACSECGCQPWFSGDIHNYNFCPNCGRDMREE